MDERERIIHTLEQHRADLARTFGVRSLALFGSLARNEATADSDVDLLVEFARPTGYFGLVALQDYLASLLQRPVDLGTLRSLKPHIRRTVEQELVYVLQ